ncbi:MAG TPA: malonate decarboxylase acyl carrier protein [Burkholderiaceae bacterium]
MAGMETLQFSFDGGRALAPFAPALVGVVASGNLEVLVEPSADTGCRIDVDTSARGFGPVWEAVLRDFHERHGIAGLRVAIHDMGATPAVVTLRLDQAIAAIAGATP